MQGTSHPNSSALLWRITMSQQTFHSVVMTGKCPPWYPRSFMQLLTLDCCPPAESLSTLKFANRAKNIKNAARLNEDVDQRTLLRKYERELKRLRAELLARQASLVDARRLLQVRPRQTAVPPQHAVVPHRRLSVQAAEPAGLVVQ